MTWSTCSECDYDCPQTPYWSGIVTHCRRVHNRPATLLEKRPELAELIIDVDSRPAPIDSDIVHIVRHHNNGRGLANSSIRDSL